MQPKSKLPTILIVVLTISLVFGPVFVPREISRWYLAAAHNAYRINDSVLAEHYLTKAESWDPDIKKDADYWIAQLPSNGHQNADQLLDLIERAVMTDMRWKIHATQAADTLAENYDFVHAVRALKIAALNQRPASATDLNQLAYMRSLAGMELDEALKDIDLAIDLDGPLPSLLDTKAWVLHGMRRNLEALGFMNEAIGGMEQYFAKSHFALPQPLDVEVPKPQAENSPPKDDANEAAEDRDLSKLQFFAQMNKHSVQPTLKQRQAEIHAAKKRLGDAGFALAVMRFHRMRILESLSRNLDGIAAQTKATEAFQQALLDRRWLVERGVPVVDELF